MEQAQLETMSANKDVEAIATALHPAAHVQFMQQVHHTATQGLKRSCPWEPRKPYSITRFTQHALQSLQHLSLRVTLALHAGNWDAS